MNRRRSIQALSAVVSGLLARSAVAQTPTYAVGATPTGIPFAYLDPKTSTMQGAMVDLIRAIAADAGFGVSFEAESFSALIPALLMNRIDIVGAAMLMTTPRRDLVDFSDPVFAYPEGLVVNVSDKTPYRSLADLQGHVVGAQRGTVYADLAKQGGEITQVALYPSLADILREISQGRLTAGVGDAPILAYQLAANVSLRARLVATYEPKLAGSIGIAVRKTDAELLRRVNASLSKLRGDGTIDKIVAKWNLK
jgi:polar amino acid transport system substrate-binding protein